MSEVCLAVPLTITVGLTKVRNEGKQLNHSAILYLLPLYSNVQNYGQRPQQKADKDTAGIDVFAQKCQVSA
jgi:hypothetical protein